MAELVGSALLSGFFSVLFERLATQEVFKFLCPQEVIKKLLWEWKVLLLSADELLDDTEEKLIYNPRVEKWHNELKDAYKAGELVDKIKTEALWLKMEGHQSASLFSTHVKIGVGGDSFVTEISSGPKGRAWAGSSWKKQILRC